MRNSEPIGDGVLKRKCPDFNQFAFLEETNMVKSEWFCVSQKARESIFEPGPSKLKSTPTVTSPKCSKSADAFEPQNSRTKNNTKFLCISGMHPYFGKLRFLAQHYVKSVPEKAATCSTNPASLGSGTMSVPGQKLPSAPPPIYVQRWG